MNKQALVVMGFVFAAVAFGCAATRDERNEEGAAATQKSALTGAQCDYFSLQGKTRICHATGSAKHPFVILNVSQSACVDVHAGHAGDYVDVGSHTCNGQGCLPAGAPSDPTVPCCESLSAQDGTCQPADRCSGVACTASDQCHLSDCDPVTGQCVESTKVDGSLCNDGDACTETDTCQSGSCVGAGSTCICTPGSTARCYTGPSDTDGVGACQAGAMVCNESGSAYGACGGEVKPTVELCGDGVDNDCDGSVDEGCVAGSAWNDANANGLHDPGESPMAGVTFILRSATSGAAVAVAVSDLSGNYAFSGVPAGSYFIEVVRPPGFLETAANVGSDDTIDNDFDPADDVSPTFVLSATEGANHIDCGLIFSSGG